MQLELGREGFSIHSGTDGRTGFSEELALPADTIFDTSKQMEFMQVSGKKYRLKVKV